MAALRRTNAVREISVVSLTEIAVKQARGTLSFGKVEVVTGMTDLRVRVLPYAPEHALALFDLPTRHPDPFDRQLIAQALVEDIAIVTPDHAFNLYDGLDIIW